MDAWIKLWGALSVPITVFITKLVNKRHSDNLEDEASDREAMIAITTSSKTLVELMTSAMAPLQVQLDSQGRELETHREALKSHQIQITALRTWAIELRAQVLHLGGDPIPPPPIIDLEGFSLD